MLQTSGSLGALSLRPDFWLQDLSAHPHELSLRLTRILSRRVLLLSLQAIQCGCLPERGRSYHLFVIMRMSVKMLGIHHKE